MRFEELFRNKGHAARRAPSRRKRHSLGHSGIHYLSVNGPKAIIGNAMTATRIRVEFIVAAKSPSTRPGFSTVSVKVIGFETFCHRKVDFSGVFFYQCFP